MMILKIFEKLIKWTKKPVITDYKAAIFVIDGDNHRCFTEGRENLAGKADNRNMN